MAVVNVLESWIVKPETPTPQPRIHKLSNLDFHISFENYTKQVYYFPPCGSNEDLVSSLQASLSRVLVPFYVLAGRVRKAQDGHKLEVDCNDAGVPFVDASTCDSSFSDWKDMASCSIEKHLNSPEVAITDPDNAPLVKVQVTKFKCGGIALGIESAEVVLDGSSYFTFVKAWSEIHRGLPLSQPPFFSSGIFQARQPPAIILPVRDYHSTPMYNHSAKAAAAVGPNFKSEQHYAVKTFEMDPDQVDDLIREIHSGPHSYGRPPTSFEATSAMIWKAITEVRDLKDSVTTSYVYAISLKGKNRWNPPVPDSYIGNSIHSPCLTAKAGDIKSNHLSYVAKLFHEDVLSNTQEHMQSAIDWMEMELARGRKINLNGDFVSGTGIYSTSLHTFPVYAADFGWGKPLHYSLVMQPWYGNGAAIVLPSPKGGRHRQLLVSLPQIHMKKLCYHELFRKYTTLQSFLRPYRAQEN